MKIDTRSFDLRFTSISIIVRHSSDCACKDDPQYRRCSCWKHLRYSYAGKMIWQPTKHRTWAGAERFLQEYRADHDPSKVKDISKSVTVREAIDTFVAEKEGQNLSRYVPAKYSLELGRMHDYLETAGVFLLKVVRLPHLTAYRSTWHLWWPEPMSRRMVQGRMKGFFKWARFAYDLQRNPALGLGAIKVTHEPTLPLLKLK